MNFQRENFNNFMIPAFNLDTGEVVQLILNDEIIEEHYQKIVDSFLSKGPLVKVSPFELKPGSLLQNPKGNVLSYLKINNLNNNRRVEEYFKSHNIDLKTKLKSQGLNTRLILDFERKVQNKRSCFFWVDLFGIDINGIKYLFEAIEEEIKNQNSFIVVSSNSTTLINKVPLSFKSVTSLSV